MMSEASAARQLPREAASPPAELRTKVNDTIRQASQDQLDRVASYLEKQLIQLSELLQQLTAAQVVEPNRLELTIDIIDTKERIARALELQALLHQINRERLTASGATN